MRTFPLGRSEKRWLKGWKKEVRRRMNLETLIASSIRFGFNSGPSIRSRRESKFHFVWSFVNITWAIFGTNRELEPRTTDLGFQQRGPERLSVHLHSHFDLHLLHLPLPSPHRIRIRSGHRSVN